MKEVKLAIDGKEVQLTDEQLKALGAEANKRINPFEKVIRFEDYYFVEKNNEVYAYMDTDSSVDDQLYASANYFNDKAFAKQVALRQLLDHKLLKYAYDNGYEATEEPNQYYVNYCPSIKSYTVQIDCGFRAFCTHFSSYKATERAIEEIVKPFVKEHPEFVW